MVLILSWVLDQFFHVTVPAEVSAAAGVLIGGVIAYFANGGKAIHTV